MLPYVRGLQFNLSQSIWPCYGIRFPDPYSISPSKFRLRKKTLEDESSSRFSQRDEPVHARSYWRCLIMESKCNEPVSFLFYYHSIFSYLNQLRSCSRFYFSHFVWSSSQRGEACKYSLIYAICSFLVYFLDHISTDLFCTTRLHIFLTCVFPEIFLDFLFFTVIFIN